MNYNRHVFVMVEESQIEKVANRVANEWASIAGKGQPGTNPLEGFFPTVNSVERMRDSDGKLYAFSDFSCPNKFFPLVIKYAEIWTVTGERRKGRIKRVEEPKSWAAREYDLERIKAPEEEGRR